MPVCAVLLERRPAMLAVRRALARSDQKILAARSPAHLGAVLSRRLCDTIMVGSEAVRGPVLDAIRREFPAMPLMVYASFRSDDAEMLLHLHRARGAALAVESLDEPVLPRLLREHSLTARRLAELVPLAERLDLTDRFQQKAWRLIVAQAPAGLSTVRWPGNSACGGRRSRGASVPAWRRPSSGPSTRCAWWRPGSCWGTRLPGGRRRPTAQVLVGFAAAADGPAYPRRRRRAAWPPSMRDGWRTRCGKAPSWELGTVSGSGFRGSFPALSSGC